jgi:PBSX family phage terminase large subunit
MPDLTAGYSPLPAQMAFHQSDATYRMFSGGFGSGKTKAGCRESIITAWQYPGSVNLVARLKYRPLLRTTMVTFWGELREMGLYRKEYMDWRKSEMEIDWINGSKTIFTNLDDIENFKSMELDTVFIDEGAEVPDQVYDILLPGRLRGKAGVSRNGAAAGRGWITTNPGASGWLRKQFVNNKVEDHEWFHAPTSENVFNPPGYNEQLKKRYTGVWYQRYHDGDWMAFEGQVFTMFDRNRHILSADWAPRIREFDILEGWDFGYVHPTAVVWIATHRRGEYPPVAFADYEMEAGTPELHARNVKAIRERFGLDSRRIQSYSDPTVSNTFQNSGESFFQEYEKQGIYLQPSEKSSWVRAMRLASFLDTTMQTSAGEMPCVLFAPRCKRLIDSILTARWREEKNTSGEDQPERIVKDNDHLFDAFTYALWTHRMPEDMGLKQKLPSGIAFPGGISEEEFAAKVGYRVPDHQPVEV